MLILSVYITLRFFYSLVGGRLARTVVTAPILFTLAGVILFLLAPALCSKEANHDAFLRVAEVGLVLLLFTDASRTDLGLLRRIRNLPARLLGPGLLLTILLGALAALVVFRRLSIWEAGILGAILAPTDAGLGQIIVNSPLAPARIRQALNVEAGFNDGLSVPFQLFFMALAQAGPDGPGTSLLHLVVEQLGLAILVGAAIGLASGMLLARARRRSWTDGPFEQLGVVAIPLLCLLASQQTGASMFIAAFVSGLAVQMGFSGVGRHSADFSEQWGQLLNLFVFFPFGFLAMRAVGEFTTSHLVYAILSPTVVRILPVAIAPIDSGISTTTVFFIGRFGPRGLASIVSSPWSSSSNRPTPPTHTPSPLRPNSPS